MLRPYRVVHQVDSHEGVPYEHAPAFRKQLLNCYYNRVWHRVGPDGRPIPVHIVEALMFTGVRVQEITRAKWKEIDWLNMTWNIPPERLKTKYRKGKARTVGRPLPITSSVLRALNDMYVMREDPNDDEALIFPSISTKKSASFIGHQTLL